MKNAFIGFKLDDVQTNQVIEVIRENNPDAEIEFFDTAWDAIGFLRGEGHVYLPAERSPDASAENAIKSSGDVQFTELITNEIPSEFIESSVVERWLNGESATKIQEEIVAEQSRAEEEERRKAEEDNRSSNPMDQLEGDWFTDNAEEPVASPYEDYESEKPRGFFRNSERKKGLAHKVEVTPETIAAERKKKDRENNVRKPFQPAEVGYCMGVTGPFGGGGKTTFAYYATQVTRMAMTSIRSTNLTDVVLIECDFKNPKLQNRLRIPRGQDLGAFAEFLDSVEKGEVPKDRIKDRAEETLERIMFHDDASDAKIIACPYDETKASPVRIREALKYAVRWAQRSRGFFVILDLDTVGHAEGVELDLVNMSNSLVVVTNTHSPEVKKSKLPWKKDIVGPGNEKDRSHIDDTKTMIRRLTRPQSENGYGIPPERIRIFFNETSDRELEKKVLSENEFDKNMIVGNLEEIKEIYKTWAGDIALNREKSIETAWVVAEAVYKTTDRQEVGEFLKSLKSSK